ncbi:MAG: hypothetical protein AB3X44_21070 [Leptothrix sp. (in: b-proteobacteria)]
MQAEDRIRLQHMIDAACTAQGFLAGRQRAELDTDQMLLLPALQAALDQR